MKKDEILPHSSFIDKVTQHLENEGVEKGNKPFDRLRETLAKSSPRQVREVP